MTTTTETSSIVCYNVSWEDSFYLSAELAMKIKEAKYVPDVIIAISRGGLVPARVVADFMLERNLLCLRAEHWGVGTKHKKVKITGSTTNLESKRVLVVDDVADSGGTLFEMVKYLKERGAASVVTAALHYKKTSIFKPDFFIEQMDEWQWIVYPWSIYEDASEFIKRIITQPHTAEQIYRQLSTSFNLEIERKLFDIILDEMKSDGMIAPNGDALVQVR